MTDLNPDTPDAPVTVPASPVSDQAAAFTRDMLILLGSVPAVSLLLGKHDFAGLIAWVQSSAGVQVVGVLLTIGTPLWRQWITRHKHADAVKMASALPDSEAIVK